MVNVFEKYEKDLPAFQEFKKNKKLLEADLGKIESGVIYTNFHGSTYSRGSLLERDNINGWSAGCLVCNKNKDYENIIDLLKNSGQKYFSVCLIKEF